MIERQFVKEKIREYQVREHIGESVDGAGHSSTTIKRTPMGDKVVIRAAKPGLVVGRKGENIRSMTLSLKKKFNLENPQLEIEEIESPFLDSAVVAERIVKNLERFGTARFKRVGHQALESAMNAGALGIEILISGKIPGSRARTWRFWQGYMKKSGSVSQRDVDLCKKPAVLKTGTVGVVVKILRPDIKLPDDVTFAESSLKKENLEVLKNVGGGRVEEETLKPDETLEFAGDAVVEEVEVVEEEVKIKEEVEAAETPVEEKITAVTEVKEE